MMIFFCFFFPLSPFLFFNFYSFFLNFTIVVDDNICSRVSSSKKRSPNDRLRTTK